jgi:uncharacterized protein
MSVYIDTSAFLSMLNVEDKHHIAAIRTWAKLLDDRDLITTTNYVVVEAIALLHARHGVSDVRRFIEDILPIIFVEWIDPEIHFAGVSVVLASSGKQSPSLVDCVSFEIIRKNKIKNVFAYDRHFADRGFNLVGE